MIDRLAAFEKRKFVLFQPDTTHPACIRFGYEIFRLRFYQKNIEIERIESVEWTTPGQATDMAGHDMKDWQVALCYNQGIERSKRSHMLRKPNQAVYMIGPAKCKEHTALLGREFISFLSGIGVHLTQDSEDQTFRRIEKTYNKCSVDS